VGSVFARGRQLWITYVDADGRRRRVATGIRLGRGAKEREKALLKAEKALAEMMGADLAARIHENDGPVTVRKYAERWLEGRRMRGLSTVGDDAARLRDHVLSVIGVRPIAEVRPREVRDLFACIVNRGNLAPKTVHNIYGTIHCLFADAVADELADSNPCQLKVRRNELPEKVDRDPLWRSQAIYSKQEARLLCLSTAVPELRRVLYAMLFLGGLRVGEAVIRRWRDYDPKPEPLGSLIVASAYNSRHKREASTKTRRARAVPVHHDLARVLAEWKLLGWEEYTGRRPTEDDLIIPLAPGKQRPRNNKGVLGALRRDCKRLHIRERRTHDTRRSFITWCRAAGAVDSILKWVTHGPGKKTVLDSYTTPPWGALCNQVLAVGIDLREAELVPVQRVRNTTEGT
jgi:integrase